MSVGAQYIAPLQVPLFVKRLIQNSGYCVNQRSSAVFTASGCSKLLKCPQFSTITSREFDVLHFLAHRSGQSLSKTQILAGVWNDDFDGDPNIVEVYIARLRRKLEAAGARASITTLRGAGYRLDGG